MVVEQIRNTTWVEKYRPKRLGEVAGGVGNNVAPYLSNPDTIPNFLFVSKQPGTGKCITKNSYFFTDKGMMSFNDYCKVNNIEDEYTLIKDNVYDVESSCFKETAYVYKSKDDTLKILTKNGYVIEGTKNHRIKVFNNKKGLIWKELQNINVDDDTIPLFYGTNIYADNNKLNYDDYNKIIEHHNTTNLINIKTPEFINDEIAFFIGVFVANGNFDNNSVNICSKKLHIHEKLIRILKKYFNYDCKSNVENLNIVCGGKKIKDFLLTVIGCSDKTAHYKFVPKKIFECSKDVQLGFIEGLLEDSWLSNEKYLEYYTSSKQLAEEIKLLLLNIGIFTTHKISYLPKYEHYYHTLVICVEHTKELLAEFNNFYDNKQVIFNTINNTNKLTYGSIIKDFVLYQRKLHNVKKTPKDFRIPSVDLIKGSVERIKNNINEFLNEEYLECLKIFKTHNVFLDKISSITENKNVDIYDFNIPHTHKFLANGIINHNTTVAKVIINELGCDSLNLNASDDRTLEVIRDKIKYFCQSSSTNGMRKCVFLDEFDGMLKQSQEALRNLMETYNHTTFFVLTANNEEKVIDPIKSRCKTIYFHKPNKDEVKQTLINICDKESLEYLDSGLDKLINVHYPSIRNMVNELQNLKTLNKVLTEDNVSNPDDEYEGMFKQMVEGDYTGLRSKIISEGVDVDYFNKWLFRKVMNSNYGITDQVKIIQRLADNERSFVLGADKIIVFISNMIHVMQVVKK